MLDRLSMTGFQAHEKTVLEFSSKVNIITGTSNSGKTSIVRALNLLINNRPGGNGFIKDDKDETVLGLSFKRRDKSFVVTRKKSRKSNGLYCIAPQEGDSEEFNSFGVNVPKEIVINIAIVDIDYRGYNNKIYHDQIIRHKDLVSSISKIFQRILLETDFPITSLIPLSMFNWNDLTSIKYNNSGAFN